MTNFLDSFMSGLSQALNLNTAVNNAERKLGRLIKNWKKQVLTTIIEASLFALSIIFIAVGLILMLATVLAAHYVFLFLGVLLLVTAIFMTNLK